MLEYTPAYGEVKAQSTHEMYIDRTEDPSDPVERRVTTVSRISNQSSTISIIELYTTAASALVRAHAVDTSGRGVGYA